MLREYADESWDIYGFSLSRGFKKEFEDSTDKLKCLNYVHLSLVPFKEIPLSPFQSDPERDFCICWCMTVKGCFFNSVVQGLFDEQCICQILPIFVK